MVEITYLMHNQAKILKRLQIPQEDCKNKDLLFYFKLQKKIRVKMDLNSGKDQTKDESFNSLMEL